MRQTPTSKNRLIQAKKKKDRSEMPAMIIPINRQIKTTATKRYFRAAVALCHESIKLTYFRTKRDQGLKVK